MLIHEPIAPAWKAELALEFERRGNATILARRHHVGPLRVQKALYPEGESVCHTILLHPPSGIAGGDELAIKVSLEAHSHAFLTTPGAGKWYRSAGPWASQSLAFELAPDSVLEWLPQETIVFNAALADMHTSVRMAPGACFMGQEILCLGRRAMNEKFDEGAVHLATDIHLGEQWLWHERGRIDGHSALLHSPTALAGCSISGTFIAAGRPISAELLAACREKTPTEADARFGITALPDLLIARYLGHRSESARHWFADLWSVLRPALIGRAAQTPRIWNT